MNMKTIKTWMLLIAGLLLTAGCANDDVAQKDTDTDNGNDKNLTTFVTGAEPTSRTSMDYASGNFYWEAGDYIYVQDDNGAWQKSSNAPTAKTDHFKFMVPGKFKNHTSYKVYYPGKNGNKDQVTISAAQTQETPNTTAHFGASGDCGTATANKVTGKIQFEFALDHQAAYLVFQPYTSNTVLKDCYLTKVEVTSDNDITDTYTLTSSGALTGGTGTGKQIVLTTQGSGAYANGFPLNTTAASLATNGAYMVIKPGTHVLKVRYWVKDMATNVEGTITKTLSSFEYKKNTYYDMTADLNVKDYDSDHYYQWDAQEQYWKGHEWWSANKDQPTLPNQNGRNAPPTYPDPRAANRSNPGSGVSNPATRASFNNVPNVNEMVWYAQKGDPRWDGDELWTTMGHLYKGGMWFKKKSQISGFNANTAPDGNDWRTIHNVYSGTPSSTLPSAADAGNYFYLPAFGEFMAGTGVWHDVGIGNYWSSSAYPFYWILDAYYLSFYSVTVRVSNFSRFYGFRAQPFSDFGDN